MDAPTPDPVARGPAIEARQWGRGEAYALPNAAPIAESGAALDARAPAPRLPWAEAWACVWGRAYGRRRGVLSLVAALLLFGGALVAVDRSIDYERILLRACRRGDAWTTRLVLTRLGEIPAPKGVAWYEDRALGRCTYHPMRVAVWSGRLAVMRVLLDFDPTLIDRIRDGGASAFEDQNTLTMAVLSRDPRVVAFLLDRVADADARCRQLVLAHIDETPSWTTPLQVAVQTDAPEIVELLLKHGADPGVLDGYDRNLLQLAEHHRIDPRSRTFDLLTEALFADPRFVDATTADPQATTGDTPNRADHAPGMPHNASPVAVGAARVVTLGAYPSADGSTGNEPRPAWGVAIRAQRENDTTPRHVTTATASTTATDPADASAYE